MPSSYVKQHLFVCGNYSAPSHVAQSCECIHNSDKSILTVDAVVATTLVKTINEAKCLINKINLVVFVSQKQCGRLIKTNCNCIHGF